MGQENPAANSANSGQDLHSIQKTVSVNMSGIFFGVGVD